MKTKTLQKAMTNGEFQEYLDAHPKYISAGDYTDTCHLFKTLRTVTYSNEYISALANAKESKDPLVQELLRFL